MIARFSHDSGLSFGEEVVLRDDYGTTERMPDLGYPRARQHLAFEFARFVLRKTTLGVGRACGEGRRHVRLHVLLGDRGAAAAAHRGDDVRPARPRGAVVLR